MPRVVSRVALSPFFFAVGIAALSGAGCASSASAAAPPLGSSVAPAAATVHVETAAAELREVPAYLALTGQLTSARKTDLAANVYGRVVSTKAERGARVKAGEVLAVLDVRAAAISAEEARANAASASSQAQAARTECDRVQKLIKSGAIAGAEVDRAEAQCRTSESALLAADARARLAAQNVGDGVIRAPFDGYVTERFVDVGEYVRADTRVVSLVDLSALRLETTIPETYIASATAGAPLSFSVSGYPDKTFHATLRFVSASVRRETRDVVAEAVVDDPDATLRPGMFASIRLQRGLTKQAVVPARALTRREDKPAVFVVTAGRVEQRFVQRGESIGDAVAVPRGLKEGDRVVLDPAPTLKNGQPAS